MQCPQIKIVKHSSILTFNYRNVWTLPNFYVTNSSENNTVLDLVEIVILLGQYIKGFSYIYI